MACCATFAAESARVEVFEEFGDSSGIEGAFFVTVRGFISLYVRFEVYANRPNGE